MPLNVKDKEVAEVYKYIYTIFSSMIVILQLIFKYPLTKF
jgi:hypothetical protein